jgi:hypothetical protein
LLKWNHAVDKSPSSTGVTCCLSQRGRDREGSIAAEPSEWLRVRLLHLHRKNTNGHQNIESMTVAAFRRRLSIDGLLRRTYSLQRLPRRTATKYQDTDDQAACVLGSYRRLGKLTKLSVPSRSRKPQNYRAARLIRTATNHDGANNARTIR